MQKFNHENKKQRTPDFIPGQAKTGVMPPLRQKETKNGKTLVLQ